MSDAVSSFASMLTLWRVLRVHDVHGTSCGSTRSSDNRRHLETPILSFRFKMRWDFSLLLRDRRPFYLLSFFWMAFFLRIAWMTLLSVCVCVCVWFIGFNHLRCNNSLTNLHNCPAVVSIFRSIFLFTWFVSAIAIVRCLVRLFRTFDPTKTKHSKNSAVNGWPFFMYHLIVAEP